MTDRRRLQHLPRWWPLGLTGLFLIIMSLIGAAYAYELRPVSRVTTQKRYAVPYGATTPQIAQGLAAVKLIKSRNAFITYVNFHGLRGRLKAGDYLLAPSMSTGAVAQALASGAGLADEMTVPEGYRITQIEALAATHGITVAAFNAALAAPHTQAFLADKPTGVSLEGYLFPDTYNVGPGVTASDLVTTMLNNFGARVGSEYTQAFAAEGLTLHQGLTLASIVESEVSSSTDRPIVAQIFLKRLRAGQSLGSDVTAQYAADLLGVPFNVNLNSPYNTRVVTGLPPGPICNPGLDALNAAAHPADTDYSYFLTGTDGKTYYADTYAQHEANIAKYLQ